MAHSCKDLCEKYILPIKGEMILEELDAYVQEEIETLDSFLNGVLSGLVKFKECSQEETPEEKTDGNTEDSVFIKPNEPHKKRVRAKKTLNLTNHKPENPSDERSESTDEDKLSSTENNGEDRVFARPSEPLKKRGRPKKINGSVEDGINSDGSCEMEAVEQVLSEEGSSRSRRAAAQAADVKRTETENFMNASKLRRPTDVHNKKAANNLSSPPAKTRKTCIGQSTKYTNSEKQSIKGQMVEDKAELSPSTSSPSGVVDLVNNNKCVILVEKLNTQRASSKRKSDDLFNDSLNAEATDDGIKSKKKGKTSSVPSVNLVQDAGLAIAKNSPILLSSSPLPPDSNCHSSVEVTVKSQSKSRKETYCATDLKLELTEEIEQKTVTKNSHREENSDVAVVETESSLSTRIRVIKKKEKNKEEKISDSMESDKENDRVSNRTVVLEKEPSPSSRARTRIIKKGLTVATSQTEKENKDKLTEEIVDSHGNIPLKGQSMRDLVASPAKGAIVKKTVEVFEKMRVDEKPITRITRAKNKALETHKTKNAMKNGTSGRTTSTERQRQTPQSSNKVTPSAPLSSKHMRGPSPSARIGTAHSSSVTTVIREEDNARKLRENTQKTHQLKEEEDRKKKQALQAKEEEKRKKEEHRQKVIAAREAREKEKALLAARLEKEKEEKQQQLALEKEKQREAEQQRKKFLQQQRAQEQEDRRKQEEAARLAKLKEQEQEHKRIIAAKEREKELKKQRKAEEAQSCKTEKVKTVLPKTVAQAPNKSQNTPQPSTEKKSAENYEVTPARDDRPLLPSKTENDYGIDDANSSDSSEDETQPKKQIPQWALPKNRSWNVQVDYYVPQEENRLFMVRNPNPDLQKIFFGCRFKTRARTSSAVWNTPPRFNLSGIGK